MIVGLLLGGLMGALVAGALCYRWLQRNVVQPLGAVGDAEDALPVAQRIRSLARDSSQRDQELVAEGARAGLLESALDTIVAGVIMVDGAGNEVLVNRMARELEHDIHRSSLLMKPARELLAQALNGDAIEEEIDLMGPPHRTYFVAAFPLERADRRVGAIAMIEDMTEVNRIDSMRRDFVANLSHELRTPIGAVSLLAETLVDEEDPETVSRLSDRLVSESSRLARTIDELLELSRIEHETDRIRNPVAIQDCVGEAMAMHAVIADSASVELGAVMPDEPLFVLGDRRQLTSAFSNLIENAVKYSRSGDTVSVRARRMGTMAEVAVQDTGIGIPQSQVGRIFERFYRVDQSRRSDTGGTGLGLSIVRHIALNHGGAVAVDSADGQGSVFTMTLPATAPPAERIAPPTANSAPAAATSTESVDHE